MALLLARTQSQRLLLVQNPIQTQSQQRVMQQNCLSLVLLANPGGGFGGAVIVEGPGGSKLVAIARVGSKVGSASVAEDYNGIAVQ